MVQKTTNIPDFKHKYDPSAIAYIDQPHHKEKFPIDKEIHSFMESSICVLDKSSPEYNTVVEEIKKMISFKHYDGKSKRDINSVQFAGEDTKIKTSSKKHELDKETNIKFYNKISEEKKNKPEESRDLVRRNPYN